MNKLCLPFVFYLLASGIFSGCAHMVPAQVQKMPMIRVLHEGMIDSVPLEKYVASVLAGEVSPSWPLEALKAQAIAARTFALLRMKERSNRPYHVQNSVMDQVFKTKPSEIFIRAARESAGLVLTNDKHLAETSFHSTCGGKTTDSKSVWGRSYPHLRGAPCGFCNASPTFNWTVEMALADLEAKFSQKISAIKILSRTADGRIDTLQVKGSKKQTLSGQEFRMALGPMRMKSTLVDNISVANGKVIIKGHGFGHGVGMCQYGALGMAKRGKSYKEILKHYYPSTQLAQLY